MIKNYKKYDVAVINYPLMDPGLKIENYKNYFDLDYTNHEPWAVPVYIHIPFCSKLCKFCIYNRELPDRDGSILKNYTDALVKEIKLYGSTDYVQSLKIGAIFIGGGTPTCLATSQLAEILKACREYLPITDDTEITVECNIQNAPEEKLKLFSDMGVSRVSTGVQTFTPRLRTLLGLPSIEKVFRWLELAAKYSFEGLSIDLLYGLPGQTCDEWENDLKQALQLPITHLSAYMLVVFAYTKLYEEINQAASPPQPIEAEIYKMFEMSDTILCNNGFYVLSTQEYSKTNRKALFWDLTYDGYGDNLSFGAFSFGFINGISYQNEPDPKKYINKLINGQFPIKMASHKITYEQLMERTLILGFRRSFVEKSVFKEQYNRTIEDVFSPVLGNLLENGLIEDKGDKYQLTSLGKYYQGNVSSEFMQSTFRGFSNHCKRLAIGNHVIPEAIKFKKER